MRIRPWVRSPAQGRPTINQMESRATVAMNVGDVIAGEFDELL